MPIPAGDVLTGRGEDGDCLKEQEEEEESDCGGNLNIIPHSYLDTRGLAGQVYNLPGATVMMPTLAHHRPPPHLDYKVKPTPLRTPTPLCFIIPRQIPAALMVLAVVPEGLYCSGTGPVRVCVVIFL